MKCLRCESAEMEIQTLGAGLETFEIDVCKNCGGTWLDKNELNQIDDNFFLRIEEINYTAVPPTESDGALRCPRCPGSVVLGKVTPADFPDVVVDICTKCGGFWLDKNEINKIRDVSDRVLIASLGSLDE